VWLRVSPPPCRALPVEANADWVLATSHYGEDFVAAVCKGAAMATQFHPEKSGATGQCFWGGGRMCRESKSFLQSGLYMHASNTIAGVRWCERGVESDVCCVAWGVSCCWPHHVVQLQWQPSRPDLG
jgi:hypothetical protein